MDNQGILGIYFSKDRAAAVWMGSQGGGKTVHGYFTVKLEEQQEQPVSPLTGLANLIAQGCKERNFRFSQVAAAIDCSMYMQHTVHSDFTELKQIATTVRFDTEEAIATDISDVAVSFRIMSTSEKGASLDVFTAKHKLLSEIITALQANKVDPVAVEPDITCLARFISHNAVVSGDESRPFFAVLSDHNCYFIVSQVPWSQKTAASDFGLRTFLLGAKQDRTSILTREIPLTMGLLKNQTPANCVMVFDPDDSVKYQQLGKKSAMETSQLDLAGIIGAGTEALTGGAGLVDIAIAYGAALAVSEKVSTVNFRKDFMPYLGEKQRLLETLKFAGLAASVLAIALGLGLQIQLYRQSRPAAQLKEKILKQYSDVMMGKKPLARNTPLSGLDAELRRIRDAKSGKVTGEGSIPAKLTLILVPSTIAQR